MWAGADDAFEAVTEGGGRPEPDLGGDPVDRVSGGFQQVLRLADAGAVQPLQWCGAGLPAEAAVECPGAHPGVGARVTSGLDLGLYLLERELGPRIAHAVEKLIAHERRGTVWRKSGSAPTLSV